MVDSNLFPIPVPSILPLSATTFPSHVHVFSLSFSPPSLPLSIFSVPWIYLFRINLLSVCVWMWDRIFLLHWIDCVCMCVYAYVRVCMRVRMYVYVRMRACICVYACMRICVYACVCVYLRSQRAACRNQFSFSAIWVARSPGHHLWWDVHLPPELSHSPQNVLLYSNYCEQEAPLCFSWPSCQPNWRGYRNFGVT